MSALLVRRLVYKRICPGANRVGADLNDAVYPAHILGIRSLCVRSSFVSPSVGECRFPDPHSWMRTAWSYYSLISEIQDAAVNMRQAATAKR